MTDISKEKVKSRRVFYIPGFDPFPARRYREIYRREAALQSDICGYEIEVGPSLVAERFGWQVFFRQGAIASGAQVEVLQWSDIVRNSMRAGIAATYLQLVSTAWRYLKSGALFRLMRLRKGPIIAAFYPIGMLLAQLAVACAAAIVLGVMLSTFEVPYLPWLAVLVIWPVLALFRSVDNRLFAYYLMHDYAFSARWNGAYPKVLEDRLDHFRARIESAMAEDVDEVLVVGHSSGAALGVSILASIDVPVGGPQVSYLSLGQVVPMLSFLPNATGLRDDLRELSERDDIFWLDVSAPGDGCCFALCDPVSVSGAATSGKIGPLVISAAFSKTLSAKRWKELRWRFFRLHFQYLCAFDAPKGYDYFRITAGPDSLRNAFANRTPSANRIETPTSGYGSGQ